MKKSISKELFVVFCAIITTLFFNTSIISQTSFLDIQFVFWILLIIFDFIDNKRINLIQIWVFGYIYIIWSDMVLCSYLHLQFENSVTFLTYANTAVVASYYLFNPTVRNNSQVTSNVLKNRKLFILIILLCVALYLINSVPIAIANILYGRQLKDTIGSGSAIGLISTACGLLSPTLIAYYFFNYKKEKKWKHLWFCLPLFAVQICMTTRYQIVYQILPYLIAINVIDINIQRKKNLVVLAVLMLILSTTSSILKESRSGGMLNYFQLVESSYKNDKGSLGNWDFKLANKMSPEGIVRMTNLSHNYFECNHHTYGKEISFMFYFWVPRTLWKNKPYPIDYWLIRKYETVSDTYSTASGFTGEVFADFGYFCYLVLFLFGYIIKRCDTYSQYIEKIDEGNFNSILSAMIYPCVFFFVRSPLTAMECFFVELGILFIIRKCCTIQTIE